MTNRSLYGAWGGGNSAGDLILPGNHGGGYGKQTTHFFKMHDGTGLAITDAKTNVTSGNAINLTWNADNGTITGVGSDSAPTFTIADPTANTDLIFIGVVNFSSNLYSFGFGDTGLSKGLKFVAEDLVFKNDVGAVTFTPTIAMPLAEDIVLYVYIDDSTAKLAWGWISATDASHESPADLAGGVVTAFTDKINLINLECYSMFMGYYQEPAASLAVVKDAAAFHFAQHRSDACKADPTKRIVYPGLI